MRYEVILLGRGKNITARFSADSLEELAELILRYHPGTTLVSCREL